MSKALRGTNKNGTTAEFIKWEKDDKIWILESDNYDDLYCGQFVSFKEQEFTNISETTI